MVFNSPSTQRSSFIPRNRLLALGLLAALYYLWQIIPQSVPDPGTETIACLSYAPFYQPGETPFNPDIHIPRNRILSDLIQLRSRSRCVRTYSIDQGLDQVPEVAKQLGMKVLLGAWISRNQEKNSVELMRALELANSYPDVLQGLVVGNEVLLRRELPVEGLRSLLVLARSKTKVPVTYADVWDFWAQNPSLASDVNFVTIHILPYWDDKPVGLSSATEHTLKIYEQAKKLFQNVFIGETGWPSRGRPRGTAVPGQVAQATFVRKFVRLAQERHVPYNLVEAFNQPWKRALEGAMGGYWGIFRENKLPAFPWHGPVSENSEGYFGWLAGLMGALLAAARAAWLRKKHLGWYSLGGFAMGCTLYAHWNDVSTWQDGYIGYTMELLAGLLAGGLGWCALHLHLERNSRQTPTATGKSQRFSGIHSLILQRCIVQLYAAPHKKNGEPNDAPHEHACAGQETANTSESSEQPCLDAHQASRHLSSAEQRFVSALVTKIGLINFIFLFAAAGTMLLLVFDPRYRGFPWALFAIPTAATLLGPELALGEDAREEIFLCWIIISCAPVVLLQEGLGNITAVGFVLLLVIFALRSLGIGSPDLRRKPRKRTRIASPRNG